MTLPEGILWRALRERPGGLKFRRQHPAGIYVIDFYCAAAALAIEVDDWGDESADARRHDAVRSRFLRAQGVGTLRVPAKFVMEDMECVIARIVELCSLRVSVMRRALHPGERRRD